MKDGKFIEISARQLQGSYMLLDEASVTGTANIVMAAVLAKGKTTIYNAACEPYIQQLCRMLNRMGAKIEGIASNLLTIEGVDELHGTEHTVLPDMIEVGSFIGMAAIICSGIMLKKTKLFAGDPAPFVMELPAYHVPAWGNVLRQLGSAAGPSSSAPVPSFWQLPLCCGSCRASASRMVSSAWSRIRTTPCWLRSLPRSHGSLHLLAGQKPAKDGRMAVAAVTGLIAKENVVATFGMLYGFAEVAEDGAEIWGNLAAAMTPIAAYGFLVFNLLCAPASQLWVRSRER